MADRGINKYNPFSHRTSIGPGPKGQKNRRANRWRCRCEQVSKNESKCVCDGIRTPKGRVSKARKTFAINLQKKRQYAKMWRAWKKRKKAITGE